MSAPEVIVAEEVPASPARTRPPRREPWRVAAVQHSWRPDPDENREHLASAVGAAAREGARLVCLAELTLSPYPGGVEGPAELERLAERGELDPTLARPEPVEGGPTVSFLAELARANAVHVSGSLWEAHPDVPPPRGYNTAVCVAPDGSLVARTRKLHIPVTEGYREDLFFAPGPPAHPTVPLGPASVGFPTCWDQWFPELARAYALEGADVIVYPSAIGSEPDHPGFDTQPLWQHVITANGITNGTFMVAINRTGSERLGDGPELSFYGSSFISDPYGRVLVQAPRDRPAVVVADLDLDAREDWLELFPLIATRRPDAYDALLSGGNAP